MNNLQSNTSGLDCAIKQFQTDLYNSLDETFDFEIEGYPRVYRNPNDDNDVIPEVWNEGKQEYEEIYLDDKNNLKFFFIDGETHTTDDGSYFTAPLKIVFIVNLSKIDNVVRADAHAQRIITSAIREDVNESFEFEDIEKGISNVFSGFKIDQINFDDMQPWHVFAVNGRLGYYLNKNCQ